MSEHIEVDRMLFFAAVIEQDLAVVEAAEQADAMLGMPGLGALMGDAAHDRIAEAQAVLDRLIAEDDTWRPA